MPDVVMDVKEIGGTPTQSARDLLDLALRRAKDVGGGGGLEGVEEVGENDSQDEVKRTMEEIMRKFGAD